MKLEITPKHGSASNPAERAIQAVEEQARTIRADCQMRFGNGETFGADKPIWAWLLRHAGWQISRYKHKGNRMTAYKPTVNIALMKSYLSQKSFLSGFRGQHIVVSQAENAWHKGDAVIIKGVWVGRTETSDEHVVLTPGGRVFSRTIRRLEPSRRHDVVFLNRVKGLPRDAEDGIVRGRPRKESALPPPILVGENSQTHNPDLPDNTADNHSESPKETDDTNDSDNVPMSETPSSDGRDASYIKSKSSLDDTSGVRQRLKFDGVESGMTPDPKRPKETVKHCEIRESNPLLGESPDKKKVRFSSEPGDGGACAIMVEELVEDYWSDEHGEGAICEGLHCKVEPDLDMTATEAALDRLLENGVVLDIPRDEGVGMKHLTTRWEKTWRKRNNEWEYKVRFVGRESRWEEFRDDLFAPGASYCTGRIVDILSLKRRVPTFTLDCTDAFSSSS